MSSETNTSDERVIMFNNTSSKTVVVFNAPPNAGKDVTADFMLSYFNTGLKASFKDTLYVDTAEYFNIDVKDLIEYHSSRDLKEQASELFPKYEKHSLKQYTLAFLYVVGALFNIRSLMSLGYYSSREALIHVSENIVKPKQGNDFYGRKLVETIEASSERYVFAPDGGFTSEIVPLLEAGYNVYIVQLERNGATFENDSRKLLTEDDFKEYSNIKFIKMYNNGSLDDLYKTITDFSFDLVLNQTLNKYGGNEDDNEIVEYEVVYE